MGLPVLPPTVETKPRDYSSNHILFWNNIALELNRITHSVGGPQGGPPISARALGILHLAIHDAYFKVFPTRLNGAATDVKPYVADPPPSGSPGTSKAAQDAVAGAAITVLNKLYTNPNKREGVSKVTLNSLKSFLAGTFSDYRARFSLNLNSPDYEYGVMVGTTILKLLEIPVGGVGAGADTYMPNSGEDYFFDDDPQHPIRPGLIDPDDPEDGTQPTRPYHGPKYVNPNSPPVKPEDSTDYLEAVEDVHRMGGAEELASCKRQPAQTVGGLFWAYDGANLIGTPPRLYNQILRQVAWDRTTDPTSDQTNAEFARLFALANVAMTDAGVYCWREKYKYELWRPLSAIRGDPTGPCPDGHARPAWRVLGAPATNSNEGGFKPPFPAYPSGHATFGAACFQSMRRFYLARDGPADILHGAEGMKPLKDSKCKYSSSTGTTQNGVPIPAKKGQKPISSKPTPEEPCWIHCPDKIDFTFISDELNGINRELYGKYDPTVPITDQAGNVRTKVKHKVPSLWYAIFENAISRIWLGVHFHFDACAGADVMVPKEAGSEEGADHNLPLPNGYQAKQLYQVHKDGSTMYKDIKDMNFFGTRGPRAGAVGTHPFGGVPLGICIADDIFDDGMLSQGGKVLSAS